MSDFCADYAKSELYSVEHVKRLLQERYGDSIVFAKVNGRRNVVCFTDVCHVILSDKWYGEKETDKDYVTEKIVKDAARLIASEIRQMAYTRQNIQQLTKCQCVMTYCRHYSVCSLKVWSDLKLSSHL